MKISFRSIDSIRVYENNPRDNAAAIAPVAKSLQQFGFRKPIVVDSEGVIICGHTCFAAAKELGLKKVPVHVAADLTPEQIKAYRIADNKTGEVAGWDLDLLSIELSELQSADYDLGGLGFDASELAILIGPDGEAGLIDPDDIPAPPDKAITQPGDLWILGDHRLLCGNSSSETDLDRLLDGAEINLVNTDPPYNVKVEPRSNNAIAAGRAGKKSTHHQSFDAERKGGKVKGSKLRAKDRPLANDSVSDAEFDQLLSAWFGNIGRVLAPGGSFYIWGGYVNCANYPPAMKASSLYFSQAIIWIKEHPVLTRKDFMGNHEWCFYGWREGGAHRFHGPNNVSDTWEFRRSTGGESVGIGRGVRLESEDGMRIDVTPPSNRDVPMVSVGDEGVAICGPGVATDVWIVRKVPGTKMVHLTEKPVELAERAIGYSSLPGDNVLDLFGGSGSTLIAAERTGRRAFLMELDQLYCDVIVKRWEAYTGKKAKRQRSRKRKAG